MNGRIRTRIMPMAVLSAALLGAGWSQAVAQAPPIRPGLWEVRSISGGADGAARPMPDLGERLKGLPPEQRAQFEKMMRERGVGVGGPGQGMQLCFTAEQMKRDSWVSGDRGGNCRTEVTSRSGGVWKWRTECAPPRASTIDGETRFSGDTAFTTRMTTTSEHKGQVSKATHESSAKWLSADCGGLKPIDRAAAESRGAASKPPARP